jgi:hypothetical protein
VSMTGKGGVALLAAFLALQPASVSAQVTIRNTRLPAAVLGGLAGLGAGSVIGISLVVTESRFQRYIHDADDVFGWRSLPVTIGIGTGTMLGIYSPNRLETSVIYGTAGMAAGVVTGLAVGSLIWDPPEGRWAGASIGAGVGLAIGGIAGMLYPRGEEDSLGSGGSGAQAGIPIVVRLRFK